MTLFFKPHDALTHFISAYLVVSHCFEEEFSHTFSARGIPMLTFPFKQPSTTSYQYMSDGVTYSNTKMDEATLLQPTTNYAHGSFKGDVNFVMVMLQPTGAHILLKDSLRGMANQVNLLKDLSLPPIFRHLQAQLWDVSMASEAVKLIDFHLCKYYLAYGSSNIQDLSPVMDFILKHDGLMDVKKLTTKFKCSERWLEKQFEIQTSLSPKKWLRLIRFRAASNYFLTHPNATWMELVAKFDYTDQAHLIRDFKYFSGSTPSFHFQQHGQHEISFNQHQVGLITKN